MKKNFAMSVAMLSAVTAAFATKNINVDRFDYYGPFAINAPLVIDSLDVNAKNFDYKALLAQPIHAKAVKPSGTTVEAGVAPTAEGAALHMLAFTVNTPSFTKPTLKVEGLKNFVATMDGEEVSGTATMQPGTHRFVIKYVSEPGTADSLAVALEGDANLTLRTDGRRSYTLDDVLHGPRLGSAEVSPSGKYLIASYYNTAKGGATTWLRRVIDARTGKTVTTTTDNIAWMPASDCYYSYRKAVDGYQLVVTNPADGSESVLAERVPDGYPVVMPDERHLLVIGSQQGPKEDPAVYQILEPEDRQPGWRNRSTLSLFDIETGVLTPLTHGHRNVSLLDVSPDSRRVLLSVKQSRYEARPTTLFTILSLDLATMKADTIVVNDGFVATACYLPGYGVVVSGSPEAFGGVGRNLPADRVPSMVDNQLFLVADNGDVTPITREFDPSVNTFAYCEADGNLYFNAENRDCISLYCYNPAKRTIGEVPAIDDLVKTFSVPRSGRTAAVVTQGMANPDRLYTLDLKTLRATFLDEPQHEMLADVDFGTVAPWSFVNSRGDSIHGRFYLPPNFDPAKKYPMIVNYYGGCSPTSRNFEGRYPHHAYAAQGYVVYVVEPSGATGFGQEFSSRHVNTAGQGVAEDIIEGTKKFCEEHPYVDVSKIGCIGASYGGFMTQYLQTVTDIFAAAISHAGISDHTSYWGQGYWGYSYSEVSMGGTYPWSHADLFVKQSPLYNADKIHTPLLFLHGDKDNNVPVGESIQMFTALKLLGRETAFVAVADQDHHILDYDKRRKWQDTIYAWFAKYLKDEPQWWDELYPAKQL